MRVQQKLGIMFVVKRVAIDYVAPARLGDALSVQTQVIKVGKVGLSVRQEIYNQSGTLLCGADVKLATLDAQTFVLQSMPVVLKSALGS